MSQDTKSGLLSLPLSGRIDSGSAPALEAEISSALGIHKSSLGVIGIDVCGAVGAVAGNGELIDAFRQVLQSL